ncbi:MAG TPA: hypothetical protein VKE51_06960 [Vicinamibacterales bacterium]|nr:hypothetical protein [Vicinamibacterales bacterium]
MSALQMPCVHDQDWINALAPLRDRRVASASDDNTIVISNPLKGSLDARLEGHSAAVNALAVLRDGRLASGSQDKTIRFWDVPTNSAQKP